MNKKLLFAGQPKIVKVLDIIRTMLLFIGFIGFAVGASCFDAEGPAFIFIILEVALSLLMICCSVLIENIMAKYFGIDMMEYNDYLDWLQENELANTKSNYEYYQNLIDYDDYLDWLYENDLANTKENYEYYQHLVA